VWAEPAEADAGAWLVAVVAPLLAVVADFAGRAEVDGVVPPPAGWGDGFEGPREAVLSGPAQTVLRQLSEQNRCRPTGRNEVQQTGQACLIRVLRVVVLSSSDGDSVRMAGGLA